MSKVLKKYLGNIKTDVYLGRRILKELKTRVDVFLGVDFDLLQEENILLDRSF